MTVCKNCEHEIEKSSLDYGDYWWVHKVTLKTSCEREDTPKGIALYWAKPKEEA